MRGNGASTKDASGKLKLAEFHFTLSLGPLLVS